MTHPLLWQARHVCVPETDMAQAFAPCCGAARLHPVPGRAVAGPGAGQRRPLLTQRFAASLVRSSAG